MYHGNYLHYTSQRDNLNKERVVRQALWAPPDEQNSFRISGIASSRIFTRPKNGNFYELVVRRAAWFPLEENVTWKCLVVGWLGPPPTNQTKLKYVKFLRAGWSPALIIDIF